MTEALDEALSPALIRQLMRPGVLPDDAAPLNLDDVQQQAVQIALDALDAQDREILQLHYEAGCTFQEIAAHLLTSPQIVEHREQDALNQLRRHLPPTREDIAASPTRRYVPAEPEPAPQKPTTESPYERKISEEQFAAFMAEHPNATYKETRDALGISSPTVQRYRRIWQESHAQQGVAVSQPESEPEPLPVQPPPEPIKEPEPPMTKPASTPPAHYERTLYEEQVYQARLWMEMRERQWREAKEFTDVAEQGYLQAKANYERAQQIARAHYAMLHGQVIENMEDQ